MAKNYIVLAESSAMQLQQEVNKMIKDGWEPLGGVAIMQTGSAKGTVNGEEKYCFAQAMIREEKAAKSSGFISQG